MSSGHSFHLNVFIKSVCQFTGWSELEGSMGEDRLCCSVHTRAVVSQHKAFSGKICIASYNGHSMPLL